MHYAVKFGADLDILEYFVEQYPDGLYFQDQDRFNLLHHAVNEGHNYMLPFLLSSFEKAANLRNKYGKTALDLAIEAPHAQKQCHEYVQSDNQKQYPKPEEYCQSCNSDME